MLGEAPVNDGRPGHSGYQMIAPPGRTSGATVRGVADAYTPFSGAA